MNSEIVFYAHRNIQGNILATLELCKIYVSLVLISNIDEYQTVDTRNTQFWTFNIKQIAFNHAKQFLTLRFSLNSLLTYFSRLRLRSSTLWWERPALTLSA